MKKIFLILLFSILWIHISYSQQYYSRNYTINDGLPDNSIRDIFLDDKGFLWLGTDAGLSQFDGRSFNTITTQDGLAGDQIWSIAEGENGHIWIGCHDGGISKIIGNHIETFTEETGLVSNFVRKIHYSARFKILLIGTEDGLSVLKKDQFISFHQGYSNITDRLQVTHFIEDNEFIYVFTNGNGLYKYMPDAESLIRIPSDHKLNLPFVNSAFITSSGDTLVNFRRKNLVNISTDKNTTKDSIGQVMAYVEDSQKNVWMAAWNNNYMNAGGLFKFDSTGIISFGKYIGVKSQNVYSVEFDSKENLIWVGTKEKGLYLYPLSNIRYYTADDFNIKDLNINDLVTDHSNNVWIALENNVVKKNASGNLKIYPLNKFELIYSNYVNSKFKDKYAYLLDKNGSFQKYQNLISAKKYRFSNPYQEFSGNKIPDRSLYKPLKYEVLVNKKLKEFNSILIDSSGNTWIGSNVGIFKINKDSEKISYHDLEGNRFNKFHFDSKDQLYAVSWADLFIYPDIENNYAFDVFNHYENKSPINVSEILHLNNEIWFASIDHGIFNYTHGTFYSTYNQDQLETHSFNDICTDIDGRIIAGGNNGIIYILQFTEDTFKVFFEIDKNDGLQGTSIRYLCCTENNLLIAGTNKGLNLIDLGRFEKTGNISIDFINKAKGFTDYSGTCCTIQDNKSLWIGSNKNLIQINLKNLENQRRDHINLYLKSILVNEIKYDLNYIGQIDPWTNIPKTSIRLPYNKNSLTFIYDAITYLDPNNVSFSYKLEGYHNDWLSETKDRKVIFQNLRPGKYRLRIKANTDRERFSAQELSIGFIIAQPFWFKWWFLTAITISVLLVIWLIIILRTSSIRKKERLRTGIAERISEFEMKALRAQMNPHFIFNVINSIQNYMLDNDVDAALGYLSDFAKLIRLTLDNVSKRRITLEEELNYIKYYINLEQMRFDKQFKTEIILPSDWDGGKILIPSMILQPFVENAIKHAFMFKTEDAIVKLEFKVTDDNILKCIIEDNGIGRKKSRELNKSRKNQSSKGTFITNERLALLNQTQQRKGYKVEIIDLYDEFELASGTRVEIFIPI